MNFTSNSGLPIPKTKRFLKSTFAKEPFLKFIPKLFPGNQSQFWDMKKTFAMWVGFILLSAIAFAQGTPPWEKPLLIRTSTDGQTFSQPLMFQDSSGVPCVIRWKGDTLICAFQWFRQPMGTPTWDRVAVKYSYDAGLSWTDPTPIIVNGLPGNYQRPFDPTLVLTPGGDSLRIFFSSSDGLPMQGLDSTVNTYSAIGTDGVHYSFEPGPRYDQLHKPVIDPAVAIFNGIWHYTAPAGAPQDGAYHCTASDGLTFTYANQIASDASHNWTGNLMLESPTELRFYGSGATIWYRQSSNGTAWAPNYINTNVNGGDPSALKIGPGNYLMVYVGPSNFVATDPSPAESVWAAPNPTTDKVWIGGPAELTLQGSLFNMLGTRLGSWEFVGNHHLDLQNLAAGIYILEINGPDVAQTIRLVKH
jgi:hypothetical protein